MPDAGVISGIDSVCPGATITLSESTTGGAWSVANGNVAIAGGLVTGISAGLDTVVYTFANVCGSAVTQMPITINPLPVSGVLTGADSLCVGVVTTLSASALGGTWTTANATATVLGGVVSGNVAGVDSVFYTTTTVCGSASTYKVLTIIAQPVAGTISGINHVCVFANTTLTDGVSGGIWTSSNNTIAGVTSGIVSGANAGLDTIIYAVTNWCGTAATSLPITVYPAPNAGIIVGMDSVCIGGTLTLTDAVTGGLWNIKTPAIALISGGIVTGMMNGIDTVIYTVNTICGTDIAAKQIYVKPVTDAGAITGASAVCMGSSITLADAVTGGTWTSGGVVTTMIGNVVQSITPGIDTVLYTVTSVCGSASAQFTIEVDTVLVPQIQGINYVCIGGRRITDTLSGYPYGGVWSLTNADAIMTMNVITGVNPGLDTAIYTATNACGARSFELAISVYSAWQCDSLSGVKTVSKVNTGAIIVYPNPSAGEFTVELPEVGANAIITVMDMYGKVIALREINDNHTNKINFNFDNLASGTYLIKVISNDTIYRGKVLIMNR